VDQGLSQGGQTTTRRPVSSGPPNNLHIFFKHYVSECGQQCNVMGWKCKQMVWCYCYYYTTMHFNKLFLRRGGLTRAGCGYPHLRGGAGWTCCAGRARVDKFFVRVTECWAKAHELNHLKNPKTLGYTEVASIALRTVGLQQLLDYDVITHCCETLAQVLAMWWVSDNFPKLPSYLVRNNSV